MVAAKQALKTAIEAQDVEGQIAAQEQIASFNYGCCKTKCYESSSRELNQKRLM